MKVKFFSPQRKKAFTKTEPSKFPLLDCKDSVDVSGVVKWFNISKGYGFITVNSGPYATQDILIHIDILRRDGFLAMPIGTYVECLVHPTDKGLQCIRVEKVDYSTSIHPFECAERTHISVLPESVLEEARVQWFDYKKGFGFLKVETLAEDVFIHVETLRRFGLTELVPDQKVLVRYGFGEKGAMVAEIFPDQETANVIKH